MATVLVTGCSKGIGFETALAFARAGHKVAAGMRTPARAPELAKIAARDGLPITVCTMDVDIDDSVAAAIAIIEKQIGPIDVLVNNAGIERMGSVEELPLTDFREVMETNYFGVIRCIKAVAPSMRKRGTGCIINISSVAGHVSTAPMAAYTASKYALESLSECLAQEMKSFGVRVAIVEPGIIDTAMSRHIGVTLDTSPYSQQRRVAALFSTALQQPTPPTLVAEKIVEIATGDSWQLRHLVGPDAAFFLGWRKAMSDEEWVTVGALPDEEWYDRIQADFGMDARPAS
ncbi:MAG: SDR family oxidoreductase [Gemmatimonadota bacterium]